MMTLRQRILTYSGIGLALIIVIVLVLLFLNRDTGDQEPEPDRPSLIQEDENTTSVTSVTQLPPARPAQTTTFSAEPDSDRLARQVAMIFVERFATYSSNNDNIQLERVDQWVTPSMRQYVRTQGVEQTAEYTGVTTDVIASRIQEIGGGAATVLVDTQRTIADATGTRDEQQSGRVELVDDGNGGWLVNAFYWEE